MPTEIRTKRIYEEPCEADGVRILADRLWPRGVSKAAAQIDLWAKELTPSEALRTWYHAHPTQEEEFATRYAKELAERLPQIEAALNGLTKARWTLVTATKSPEQGHVAVLKRFLETLLAAE